MDKLIILHGALGSAKQFQELKNKLHDKYEVHTLDFNGHGENTCSGFSINTFVEQLKSYVLEKNLKCCKVFGYSMGGYVALLAQSQNPELFGSIITLGTKFKWTEEESKKEVKMIKPEIIEEKVPKFASYLASIQSPTDWKENMRNTQELMLELGRNPLLAADTLKKVTIPVSLNLGADDTMVTKDETLAIDQLLPNSTFRVIEGVPHPIQMIEIEQLVTLIK